MTTRMCEHILKEVVCYNCHSSSYEQYARECGFNLVKCNECGLLYVNPRPPDERISAAQRIGEHEGEYTLRQTGKFLSPKVASYSEKVQDLFGGVPSAGTWLDVGCGHGEFMIALRLLSADSLHVKGLEPNVFKRRSASSRGLDVAWLDIADCREGYDYISFLNVFSHLPDPPAFIRLLAPRLKTGGELVIQTGDTADVPAGYHPRPLLLPDHLSFASERIVRNILKQSGFEVIEIRKYPAFAQRLSVRGVGKEVLKLCLPNKRSKLFHLYGQYRCDRMRHSDMWIRARLMKRVQ